MTQKEYNVYELQLSMDKVQSHLSLCMSYIERLTSYLPALTASPVTEGWALFHYVHPVSKSNDLTKGKKKNARCRGD